MDAGYSELKTSIRHGKFLAQLIRLPAHSQLTDSSGTGTLNTSETGQPDTTMHSNSSLKTSASIHAPAPEKDCAKTPSGLDIPPTPAIVACNITQVMSYPYGLS